MRCLVAFGLLAFLPAAATAQTKPVDPVKVVDLKRSEPVAYEKEIEPILNKHCTTCHSGKDAKARLDLDTYEGLVKGGKRGPTIIAGKGEASLLYKSAGRTIKPFMPPPREAPAMSPQELALIKLWIDQGAKAPTGPRIRPKVIVGIPPATVTPVRALAVSPDKKFVAAGRGNQIHLYEGGKGPVPPLVDPELKSPDGKDVKAAHLALVDSMAFSPDGKILASGSFQEVNLWDAESGNLLKKLTGFGHCVVALAFSADGKMLATGGGPPSEDGEVKVFEVGSWNPVVDIKNGHSDTVYGVSFSPDSKLLASCGADKFIKVFEIPSGKFVKSFEGHTHHVLDVGWKADGKLLASAGADNTVKIWDYEKGEQTKTVQAHTKQVTRLIYLSKAPQFLTCSGDQQVKLWSAEGNAVKTFAGNSDFLYALGVSGDGKLMATGGEEGVVRLYNVDSAAAIATLVPPDVQAPMPPKK